MMIRNIGCKQVQKTTPHTTSSVTIKWKFYFETRLRIQYRIYIGVNGAAAPGLRKKGPPRNIVVASAKEIVKCFVPSSWKISMSCWPRYPPTFPPLSRVFCEVLAKNLGSPQNFVLGRAFSKSDSVSITHSHSIINQVNVHKNMFILERF